MKKFIECPFDLKAINDVGTFSGYASIFGNVDQGGDVMERGSFKEFHKTRDGKVLILYQHNSRDPIGKADVRQDEKGLYFDGQLVMEDATARKAYVGMKAGTIDAMSFGFDVLPGGATITEAGIRKVTAVKLWEISPVTFGMNELARIEAVKAAQQVTNIREFEDFLRDVGGFSKAQAKLLASGGWKAMPDQRDVDGEADQAQQFLKYLNSLTETST
jgi:HK97 family phage prohead protease